MTLSSSSQTSESLKTSTLVDLLRTRALQRPTQLAYIFLNDRGVETESLTYQELHQRAIAIASGLQAYNANGKPVLLLYPPGLEFIAAFFGCLYAGALAVPVYPPRRNQLGARLDAIRIATRAKLALTNSSILSSKGNMPVGETPELDNLEWINTTTISGDDIGSWRDPQISGQTLAFLQFTSGSTATPKGVMLSHENLLYNQRMIEVAFEHTEESIVLGWLPLYHDMGLIGNVLQPLYIGIPCILMSPLAFLLKPYRWLEAITRFRATTSGAPDFAYDLCVRKITPEQCSALDLSTWDLAFCGSERVHYGTIERFADKFAACGFRREAFYPCYGLAEATLLVSGGTKTDVALVDEMPIEAPALDYNLAAENGGTTAHKIVSCGTSKLDQRIIIVDPDTLLECPPGTPGEIWVTGPNLAQGYWNNPEETEKVFRAHLRSGEGPFLRTGDLGFLKHGELFVQGRIKDVIIVRGCNFYPEDIEQSVERSNEALKPRRGAAFAVESNAAEHLIIVQEVVRNFKKVDDVNEIVADIRQAVTENHGIQVHTILLIRAGSIPLTSSGKIQRAQCKKHFLNHSLDVVGSSHPDPMGRLITHREQSQPSQTGWH